MKFVRRAAVVLLLIFGSSFVGWYFRLTWLPMMGRWLDIGETPRKVDYVMSLPGDEDYRPFLAAAMINAHFANQALVIQNEPTPEELDGLGLPNSEIIRRVYRYCGIPESNVVTLAGKSVSTAGDIDVLRGFLREHPEAHVAIVTSDYHTRRARWIVRQHIGNSADQLLIVSAPNGEFDFSNWWQTESGFLMVINEYVKLAAYFFVYGTVWWWLAGLITAIVLWRVIRRIRQPAQVSQV